MAMVRWCARLCGVVLADRLFGVRAAPVHRRSIFPVLTAVCCLLVLYMCCSAGVVWCAGVLSREDLVEYLSRITGFAAPVQDPAAEGGAAQEALLAGEVGETKGGEGEDDSAEVEAGAGAGAGPTPTVSSKVKAGLALSDIEEVVDQLFLECVDSTSVPAPGKPAGIVVADYIRIVALSEFATKLRLTI
jgi:hypothetical protein